jgi:hypothetical protein
VLVLVLGIVLTAAADGDDSRMIPDRGTVAAADARFYQRGNSPG